MLSRVCFPALNLRIATTNNLKVRHLHLLTSYLPDTRGILSCCLPSRSPSHNLCKAPVPMRVYVCQRRRQRTSRSMPTSQHCTRNGRTTLPSRFLHHIPCTVPTPGWLCICRPRRQHMCPSFETSQHCRNMNWRMRVMICRYRNPCTWKTHLWVCMCQRHSLHIGRQTATNPRRTHSCMQARWKSPPLDSLYKRTNQCWVYIYRLHTRHKSRF